MKDQSESESSRIEIMFRIKRITKKKNRPWATIPLKVGIFATLRGLLSD
ncbi:MAG: hypothetical protein PVH61_18240 [Candidatus Aminicenantes bacterium]|jgi:hypothetical protein